VAVEVAAFVGVGGAVVVVALTAALSAPELEEDKTMIKRITTNPERTAIAPSTKSILRDERNSGTCSAGAADSKTAAARPRSAE